MFFMSADKPTTGDEDLPLEAVSPDESVEPVLSEEEMRAKLQILNDFVQTYTRKVDLWKWGLRHVECVPGFNATELFFSELYLAFAELEGQLAAFWRGAQSENDFREIVNKVFAVFGVFEMLADEFSSQFPEVYGVQHLGTDAQTKASVLLAMTEGLQLAADSLAGVSAGVDKLFRDTQNINNLYAHIRQTPEAQRSMSWEGVELAK